MKCSFLVRFHIQPNRLKPIMVKCSSVNKNTNIRNSIDQMLSVKIANLRDRKQELKNQEARSKSSRNKKRERQKARGKM
jgi:hypothetical protein